MALGVTQLSGFMSGGGSTIHLIYENGDFYDLVLTTELLANGWTSDRRVNVLVDVKATARIGSTSTATAGFRFDALPSGSMVILSNWGKMLGKGGNGATGGAPQTAGTNGTNGGPAIRIQTPLVLRNYGVIGGGGGGGGSGAGGGCSECYDDPGGGGGGGAGLEGGNGGPAPQVGLFLFSNYFRGVDGGDTYGGCWGRRRAETVSSEWAYAGEGGRGGHLGQPGQPGGSSLIGPILSGGLGGSGGTAIVDDATYLITETAGTIYTTGNAPPDPPNCWSTSDQGGNTSPGGGCFDGDTMVSMADGTKKKIMDVRPGDRVVSMAIVGLPPDYKTNGNGFLSWSTLSLNVSSTTGLVQGRRKVRKKVRHSVNSGALLISDDQTILCKTSGTWTFTVGARLAVGDLLWLNGRQELVRSIVEERGVFEMYDIDVKNPDTYLANGFLVHNKTSDREWTVLK